MKIIITDIAHNSIDNLLNYNLNFYVQNTTRIINRIYEYIYNLKYMPYIGRYVPEISDKNFRELIFKKSLQTITSL